MEFDSIEDRTILEYVWKSAISPSDVTDEDVQKLRDIGLTYESIVEVQEILGLMLGFINFYDSLLQGKSSENNVKDVSGK
jgi:alkylhydroperoxidase family enzyme